MRWDGTLLRMLHASAGAFSVVAYVGKEVAQHVSVIVQRVGTRSFARL